jgi:hypothetical protein
VSAAFAINGKLAVIAAIVSMMQIRIQCSPCLDILWNRLFAVAAIMAQTFARQQGSNTSITVL